MLPMAVAVALTHLMIATRRAVFARHGCEPPMIATLTGLVAERDGESLVVQTDGGVGYAVSVPVGVAHACHPGAPG